MVHDIQVDWNKRKVGPLSRSNIKDKGNVTSSRYYGSDLLLHFYLLVFGENPDRGFSEGHVRKRERNDHLMSSPISGPQSLGVLSSSNPGLSNSLVSCGGS